MTFAGGPFNSFVLQATAAMAHRVRDRPGRGLVTTVSGMLTKPGLAVWANEPGDGPPLIDDYADEAVAATETVDVVSSYEGPATIAAYTVTYDGLEPKELVAIVDTADGARAIAKRTDAGILEHATTDELVGTTLEPS
jgi:acetyl-CoA C-acetyltransferase